MIGGPNTRTLKVTCSGATSMLAADKYVVAKYALLNCFRHQKFAFETVVGTTDTSITVQLTVEPIVQDPGNPTACPG